MNGRAELIEEFLNRLDPAAVATQVLATAAAPSAFLDPHLVRRLRVSALADFDLPVDAETDLWWSPLVRNVTVSGGAIHEDALPMLYERFASWVVGSPTERKAAALVGHTIRSHPSNPLRQAQERVVLASLGLGDPTEEIADQLQPVIGAILEGRKGVVRWAQRSMTRLPEQAKRSVPVWSVAVAVQRATGVGVDLGDQPPDSSIIDGLQDVALVELAVRWRDDVLELGAIDAERTSGILVPDTLPRVVEICRSPSADGERVSIRSGELVTSDVGSGPVFLRTLAGQVYEIEQEVTPQPVSKVAPKRPLETPSVERTDADLVIVIPGTFGSVLQRDGRDLWNVSANALTRMLLRGDSFTRELTLEGYDDSTESHIDGVEATALISDISIIPGLWRTGGYGRLLDSLTRRSGLTPDVNLVSFAWDWRRDIRLAARQLANEAQQRLEEYRSRVNPDAKLVLVGSDLGGLVATWFTDVLDGSEMTRLVVTLGTPFRGSVNALEQMVNGRRVGIRPVSIDMSDMLRSFTSMYQMLPTYPCVEIDGKLVSVSDFDLPNVDPARVGEALEMHNVLIEAGSSISSSGGRRLVPIVGTGHDTPQSIRFESGQAEALNHIQGEDYGGDGTIPLVAAYPVFVDSSQITSVTERHGQLQESEQVLNQLDTFIRFSSQPQIRATHTSATVSLEVGDSFDIGAPIDISITSDSQGPLIVTLRDESGSQAPNETLLEAESAPTRRLTTSVSQPGIYRLEVAEPSGPVLASEVIIVGFDEQLEQRSELS
ncbi:MAG: esterase/lipase family protein [Acidimicrobiales bacterium]